MSLFSCEKFNFYFSPKLADSFMKLLQKIGKDFENLEFETFWVSKKLKISIFRVIILIIFNIFSQIISNFF